MSLLADEVPGPGHQVAVGPIPALRPELESLHMAGPPERTTGALRHF